MTLTAAVGAVRWRVHLPTADSTCIRLRCAPRDSADPWPLSAPVHELLTLGAARTDRPHAVGAGRGIPILHTQRLRLGGLDIELQSHHLRDNDEVSLTLPAWDELTTTVENEDDVWLVVDTVAAASGAGWGCLGDGEPVPLGAPPATAAAVRSALRHHVGLLLPVVAEGDTNGAPYRELEQSGLTVLLR